MSKQRGIDVSSWQGVIDWKEVKKSGIEFAMIRAGYGNGIKDPYLEANVKGCKENNINFGLYWFSYALDINEAIIEANSICNLADKYQPNYPICFDYEYDSYNNAVKKGKTPSIQTMIDIATTFLSQVEKRGYYAMFYSNYDYLNRVFSGLLIKYDIWYALWSKSKGNINAGIWQYSATGKVSGISGNVDLDISYKDYPSIIANMNKENEKEKEKDKEETQTEKLNNLRDKYWNEYYSIAQQVIKGFWGNGNTRRTKLRAEGYDVSYVQAIVDCIMENN